MISKSSKIFFQTIGFGMLAGVRSMSAPALISHYLANRFTYRLSKSPLWFIKSPAVSRGLKLMAVTEMLGDKLPVMPDRISPSALTGRGISGGLVGATIYKTNGGTLLTGAVIGCAAAIAATYASFYLRKYIKNNTSLSNPALGIIEDVIALSAGIGMLKK
jgi:uncharacterized membrane protein